MFGRKVIPVVIPYFKDLHNKGKEQLERCLKHLKNQTIRVKPIVIDDSFECNRFTKTVNIGLKKCLKMNCDYIVVLNQDMYLDKNAIDKMCNFMYYLPRCGIDVPLQVSPIDNNFVINGGTWEAWPFGRHKQGKLKDFHHDETFWANGTCMMLRRSMVEEIGLFDENFKMICSDSDYSFTARSRGWKIWVDSNACGIHECGTFMNATDIGLAIIKLEDMLYFAKKWITGDLYKSMCFERNILTPEFVGSTIQKYEERLQEYRRVLE